MPGLQIALPSGALLGGTAVILGAFGAHALESAIGEWSLAEADRARRLETWEIAVRYQMYHALALIAIGMFAKERQSRVLSCAAASFLVGTAIFSGCLYAYTLTGIGWLGAVVPVGGLAFICGWFLFAWGARNS